MTFAEICLLVAGGYGLYALLTPVQRWLERYLIHALFARYLRIPPDTIDLTDFTTFESRRKDDHPT